MSKEQTPLPGNGAAGATQAGQLPLEEFTLRTTILEPQGLETVPRLAGAGCIPLHLPVALSASGQELLVDFGVETVGYFSCELRCEGNAVVTVLFGESRTEALSDDPVDVGWYRRARDVISAHAGSTAFRTAYRRGFRYVRLQFTEGQGAAIISRLRVEQVHYPFAREGRFACSEPLLNRIWEISRRTMILTSQQWYEDGVKRDGMLWVGDYRVSYLCNTTLFGDAALARKCLTAFALSQLPSGAIPATGNNGGLAPAWERNIEYMSNCGSVGSWHSKWLIANYAYDWVMSLYEYYEHTADEDLVRLLWPQASRAIEWVIRDGGGDPVMDNGEGGKWYGSEAWMAIWRYWAVQAGRSLARLVSDSAVESQCADYLCGKGAEICERFIDRERGYLSDKGSSFILRHASAAALLAGLISPGEAAHMFERLALDGSFRKEHVGMAKFYVLWAMMKSGRVAEALADIREYYGCMLDNGATTCWESCGLVDAEPIISRCHGWTAGPAYLFPKYLLGVHPAAPGFSRVRIEPHLGGLRWAEGTIPLPQGDLSIRLEAGARTMGCVVLPAGVEGDLIISSPTGVTSSPLHPGENAIG